MKFESIIFDVDGTLWDSRALLAQAGFRTRWLLTDKGFEEIPL